VVTRVSIATLLAAAKLGQLVLSQFWTHWNAAVHAGDGDFWISLVEMNCELILTNKVVEMWWVTHTGSGDRVLCRRQLQFAAGSARRSVQTKSSRRRRIVLSASRQQWGHLVYQHTQIDVWTLNSAEPTALRLGGTDRTDRQTTRPIRHLFYYYYFQLNATRRGQREKFCWAVTSIRMGGSVSYRLAVRVLWVLTCRSRLVATAWAGWWTHCARGMTREAPARRGICPPLSHLACSPAHTTYTQTTCIYRTCGSQPAARFTKYLTIYNFIIRLS